MYNLYATTFMGQAYEIYIHICANNVYILRYIDIIII